MYRPALRYFQGFVGIIISRWDGESEVQIPTEIRDFFLVQNIKTSSGAHTASSSIDNRLISLKQSGRGMKLTNRHHLMSIIKKIGAINPLPLMTSWCKQGQIYFDFDYFLVSNFFDGFPLPGRNSLYSLSVKVLWGLSERLRLFENFVIISELQSTNNNIYLTNGRKSDGDKSWLYGG
jgi:hypothetical protein